MCRGLETGEWLTEPTTGQLEQRDPFRLSWLDAGTTEYKTQQTLLAVAKLIEGNVRGAACKILTWK